MGVGRSEASGSPVSGNHPKSVINPLVRISICIYCSQGSFAYQASALVEEMKALFCSHRAGLGWGPSPLHQCHPEQGGGTSLELGMPMQGCGYFRAEKGEKCPFWLPEFRSWGLLLGSTYLGSRFPHLEAAFCSHDSSTSKTLSVWPLTD